MAGINALSKANNNVLIKILYFTGIVTIFLIDMEENAVNACHRKYTKIRIYSTVPIPHRKCMYDIAHICLGYVRCKA